jgi:tetratricopeptide (TPR) repeat protein
MHRESFGLIIAAKDLSDGDGFELLAQCKVDPATSTLPFILLSDDPDADEAPAAEGGAFGVLGKPVRVKTVVAMVADAVGEGAQEPEPAVATLPDDAVFTVEYRSFVASMGDLPEEANSVIRMFDGKRTLAQAIADCDVADDICRGMIPRLIEIGVLSPNSASATAVDAFVTARETASMTTVGETDVASRLEAEARAAEEFARRAAEDARRAADEARRKAEEARRKAEEERQRREDEERQRAIAEIEELDATQREIEEVKAADLESAQQQADEVMRAAEAQAASLAAEARRKASELDSREAELQNKRQNLTARLAAIGGAAPVAPRPAAAVDQALEREREAMNEEASARTMAFSPSEIATKAAGFSATPESAGSDASLAAVATGAAAAATTSPPSETSNPEFGDSFFKDSSFFAAPDAHGGDDELFAEPEKEGVPPIWIFLGLLGLLGLFILVLESSKSGDEPEEPTPAVETDAGESEAAEASGDQEGSGEEVAEGPTDEELAVAALEEATTSASDAAMNQADDIEFGAREVAAALLEDGAATPELVPIVDPTPRAERPPEERPPATPEESSEEPPREEAQAETDADRALEQCANFSSSGNYAETIESCQNAVRANPRSSNAYTYLGKAHYELGDVDSAINFLQQAVRIDGRNRTALLALGAARQEAGDNSGAREAYERYLEINPNSRSAAEVRSILETL